MRANDESCSKDGPLSFKEVGEGCENAVESGQSVERKYGFLPSEKRMITITRSRQADLNCTCDHCFQIYTYI